MELAAWHWVHPALAQVPTVRTEALYKLWLDTSHALKRGRLVNLSAIVEWRVLGERISGLKTVLVLCSVL